MMMMRRLSALVAAVLCLSACDVSFDEDVDRDDGAVVKTKGKASSFTPIEVTPKIDRAATRIANRTCKTGDGGTVSHSQYRDFRNRGTARRLEGKVGVVMFDVASPTKSGAARRKNAAIAAVAAKKALLREAEKRGVRNLAIGLYVLPVNADVPMQFAPSEPGMTGAADRMVSIIRAATGHDLRDADAFLQREGYRERAIIINSTAVVPSAGVAFPDGSKGVDVAMVDIMSGDDAPLFAHELLHLFGADDLYDIARFDPRDGDDVMANGTGICVKDATAWAIGWTKTRPPRAYFGLRANVRDDVSDDEDRADLDDVGIDYLDTIADEESES